MRSRHPPARAAKFRQAAFVYLHVALLYLAAVWTLDRAGMLPERGPVWLWLLAGVAVAAFVFWGLWSWQHPWFARIVWGVHALRLPALIGGAFVPRPDAMLGPGFYLTALAVVVVNLWMLARAGWDL